MKGLANFLRTTLLGGILFLVPLVAFVFILQKAWVLAQVLVRPIATHLPFKSLLGLETPKIIAVGILVLFCFLAGLLAKARFAQRSVVWLENTVLSFIPGYEFIKSMATMTVGQNEALHQVVLVRIEDALQIGFLVERIDDIHAAVFVPDAPNPRTGAIFHDRRSLRADGYSARRRHEMPPSPRNRRRRAAAQSAGQVPRLANSLSILTV